jgi:starch synthase (maltosyl-transferring)
MPHAPLTSELGSLSSASNAPTVVFSDPYPCIEGGRYAVKRVVDEPLTIWVDVFKDGHDVISAVLRWRAEGAPGWQETPLDPVENDRWTATCSFPKPGNYEYTFEAWPDAWRSWKQAYKAKLKAAADDLRIEQQAAAALLEEAADRAEVPMLGGTSSPAPEPDPAAAEELRRCAEAARTLSPGLVSELLLSDDLQTILDHWPDRRLSTSYRPLLRAQVDRAKARFSAWYEFFPRNAEGRSDRHSSFRDCLARLDDAAAMGFDVIYLPPIHPIGTTARKGKNNATTAAPGDVGSPWAIGGLEGGHRAVHPELGTLDDFRWFREQAEERGLELALDFALNCSPDHPYVRQHPEWFHRRPDGSIRYAENPPKKYQDIYPLNFHCQDWRALWAEIRDLILFWCDQGVRIFRVDNPHTKPVAFWEQTIHLVRSRYPDTLFLAEAFTRPKMMAMLGKIGFSQSYTYFTWRTSAAELKQYGEELAQTDWRWYFRPNFWPNTPDILPFDLMGAAPAAFKIRAALAATLSSNWGIFAGYEFCENEPMGNGKEEYLNSDKYELRQRDWDSAPNIKPFLTQLNRIRIDQPALQLTENLYFASCDNDKMLAYAKLGPDGAPDLFIVVLLDPQHPQAGNVHLPPQLGLTTGDSYSVEDILHGGTYQWHGTTNYVSLDPHATLLHAFKIIP